jgi:chemosensory pili system protein ChpA (sensor histidine kinase/response regulator)
MLKETVLAYRRLRDLPPDKDEETLKPLLESIPQIEGGSIGGEEVAEIEATIGEETIFSPVAEEERAAPSPFIEEETSEPSPVIEEETIAPSPVIEGETAEPSPLIMGSFYEEAEAHLEEMSRTLNTLESKVTKSVSISPSLRDLIRQVMRSVHTLKGAAGMVGRRDVSRWAHSMEDLLEWIYDEAVDITPKDVKLLVESGDLLEGLVTDPQKAHSSKILSLSAKFEEIMGQAPSEENEPVIDMKEILARPSTPPVGEEGLGDLDKIEESEFFIEQREVPTDVPFRYSRTLRVKPEKIDELVNLAGELTIALSGFDQNMAIFTDGVNELELSRDRLKDISRDMEAGFEKKALKRLSSPVNLASAQGGASFSAPASDFKEFDEFDSLELDRYSELSLIIRALNESAIDTGTICTQLSNLYSDFDGYVTRQRVLLSELQDKMMQLRMTPMSVITNRLRRIVREVATNLGKQVRLVIKGEDIELDRLIWEKITDPLMHLLRNAIDHGIEPPALRQALEKRPVGTISLSASREGNQVVIRISDDGMGLNYETIKATAKKLNLWDNVEGMPDTELASLIFHPGFSTRSEISEVSGRGVGLDVVKENIQDLKGTIRVASQAGEGAMFTVRIPLTLAVVRGLLFSAAGRTFAVALNEIGEIVRINPKNITREPEEVVRIGEEVLPLYDLGKLLGSAKKNDESAPIPIHPLVLVAESDDKRVALAVDALIDQREIFIKNLGSHLRYVKGISGATIMGDGSVVPIINIGELLGSKPVTAEIIAPDQEFMMTKPLEILIVDDSISVRQVVARLIEAQGWNTRTARDGMEALERVRESKPDLIVLDIEMPRMNGYEFMSAMKAQPEYGDVPIVVLTSRTAKKHREKAKSLGAKGFVVKPYRDKDFIDLIERLTGLSE